MKKCSKCKKEKSRDNFYKRSDCLGSFSSSCKECKHISSKKWYKDNLEKFKENNKNWRKANPERAKESARKSAKKWRKTNPEKVKCYSRKKRAMKQAVNENYTAADVLITFEAFNNQCYNCNSTDDLCVDHHRPLSKGNALSFSNAVILCRSCNSSKIARNPEEYYGLKVCGELDILLSSLKK